MWRRGVLALCVATGAACAQAPRYPRFQGKETESWLAYDVPTTGREPRDLLASFAASAHNHGCRTEYVGTAAYDVAGGKPLIGDENRTWDGVVAACGDENVALVTRSNGVMAVGCTKPTTQARCDALLQKIADAGP
jgi:hypothetical protein